MSMSFRVAAFPMILMTALSACVGGGGGSGERGSVIREVPFTSFSAVGSNETVVMPGVSQTGSGTTDGFNLDDPSNGTAKLTYDANRNLSGFSLSTPQSGVAFGAGEISCIKDRSCTGTNATSQAVVVDPNLFAWNYQSFGVWLKDVSPGSFQAGAISAGAASPVSALPLSTGHFTGTAGGFYFDSAGNRFTTDAWMAATADFQTRRIQFSTFGTELKPVGALRGTPATPNSGLDLSGTLSYAPGGINQFSGSVNTANRDLTGSASGRFYGPNAEEIGGTYGLTGNGASMLGGFSGKR